MQFWKTVLGCAFVLFLIAGAAMAACPTPTVDISYEGPNEFGQGKVHISYNFPGTTQDQRQLARTIQGPGFISSDGFKPAEQSGVWSFGWDVSCYYARSWEFKATATSCGSATSSATDIENLVIPPFPPTVALSYDANDRGKVTIDYSFPNTSRTEQRSLVRTIEGPGWVSSEGKRDLEQSGTWAFGWDVTCYKPGTYAFKATAKSCNGYTADSVQMVTVPESTPTADISFVAGESGVGEVQIAYDFPNTYEWTQRTVRSEIHAPGWTSSDVIRPAESSGVWKFGWSVACWPHGTYDFVATSTNCKGVSTRDVESVTANHTPTASITVAPAPSGLSLVSVEYAFPQTQASSQRYLQLQWAPSGRVIATIQPGETSGTWPVEVSGCNSGTDDMLKVVAVACGDEEFVAFGAAPACETSCSIECPDCVFDPIRVTSGNVRVTDGDPVPAGSAGALERTYDSLLARAGAFGRGWTSMFDAWAKASGGADGRQTVIINTETNTRIVFRAIGGVYRQIWPAGERAVDTLVYDPAEGTFLHRPHGRSVSRVYRASDGRLVAIRRAASATELVIEYDAAALPLRVRDSGGIFAWTIATNVDGTVASIALDGQPATWSYSYDGDKKLVSVSVSGTLWRTYAYGATGLEESRDGSGHLIEAHSYADGRGTSSIGPSGDGSITYDLPGRVAGETVTRVTRASGETVDYYSRYIAGKMRTVEISGSCSCGSETVVYARDESGRVIREQGATGYITMYVFDDTSGALASTSAHLRPAACDPKTDANRCRLDPEALATALLASTPATVVTSHAYADPNWPDRPTSIETSSVVAAGRVRREQFTYHAISGEIASHKISGWNLSDGAEGGDPGDGEGDPGDDGRNGMVGGIGSEEATGEPVRVERATITTFYGDAMQCDPSGDEGCQPDSGLAPVFDPGGSFQSAWLALPQAAYLRKTIDGPRLDVADLTSFVYYPVDPTVPTLLRGRLAAMRNAAGQITRYEEYDVFGNVTRMIDPNGVATEMTYDALGRLVTSTLKGIPGCDIARDPLCATDLVTTRTYVGTGPLDTETRPDDSVTKYTYDARLRVQTISRGPSATDLRERIEYSYDPVTGQKTLERTLAFDSGGWRETRRQSFAYDEEGRLATVTHADGASAGYEYKAGGQIATLRDENHAAPNTLYDYDPARRLTEVTQTLATAPGGAIVTRYAYDIHGNQTSVTDPNGNVTSFSYNDFGEMVSQTSPVTGTTTYTYDTAGNLIATTDANGATTRRSYDALGRVLAATATRGAASEQVSWTYDAGAFGIGRVGSVSDPTGSTSYSYERRGLLASEAKTAGGATWTAGFAYDANGNRSRIDHPSGGSVTFGFDFAGRQTSASFGAVPLVVSTKYLPFGPPTEIVYGNGTRRRRPHDARYRPTANALDAGGEPIASYAYTHDLAGNITRIDDLIDPSWSRSFGYDDLNRLVTANGPWGAGAFAYDAMGNMTNRNFTNGRSASFTYAGARPKLASVLESGTTRNVAYDAAGNELAIRTMVYDERSGEETVIGESLYGYTPRNHLAQQSGVRYLYDGQGIRTVAMRPAAIASFTVAPITINGGSGAEGTITLTSPAPAGGALVSLVSNHAAVTVPSRITITAGQVAATFTIATQNVMQETPALIAATMSGATRSVAVTVIPSLQIAEMRLSAESVVGGTNAFGTVSVSGAIPESGVAIGLLSSSAAVIVPESVAVEGGREFARFPVTTTAVTSPTTATITATLGTSTAEATITVLPLTMTLTFTPSPMYGGLPASGEVTLNAPAPAGGATVTLASPYEGIVLPPSVIVAEGTQSATFEVSASPVEEEVAVQVRAAYGASETWATLPIAPPVLTDLAVTPATVIGSEPLTAVVTVNAPAAEEGAGVPIETSHPEVVTSPVRGTVLAGETTGSTELTSDWVATTTPVVVSATRHGVTRSTTVTLEPPPVTLSSFSITPTSLIGTNDATGTVVLTGAALEGGLEIELATSNRAVASPPPSVVVPEGATQATFTIATSLVGSTTAVTISSWHATTTKDVVLTITPPAGNHVADISVRPAFIVGGTTATGSVVLAAPAPGAGVDVLLASSDATVTVPSSIRVSPNATSAGFTVSTTAVTEPVAVTITATSGGVIQRERVIVARENAVTLSSFAVTPDHVVSESVTTGIVMLTAAAPYGGADVTIEPNRRNIVTVPATVTVPEGATSATFTITADRLNASKGRSVDIVSMYNGVSATANVTVLPKAAAAATPQPVALCASLSLAPCLTTTALDLVTSTTATAERQYFLYTPELNLLAETTSSTVTAPPIAYEYIWFAGEPLAQVNVATGEIHYYFNDHLGTPILQTDETARIVWQAEYDPYGGIHAIRHGEGKHQPLRLPGQEADDATDTAYNIYRWYRSNWGRYTQSDPLDELRASEPNLYLYARARPTRFTDPLGLWAIDDSCSNCPFGGRSRVQEGVDIACNKFLKKPKCASLVENLTFGRTMDGRTQEALGPCMRRLCQGDKKVYCAINTDRQQPRACARANPGGAITLMRGAQTQDCYFDQGGGWSHTIFHEMVHVCGLTDEMSESYDSGPYSALFRKIMWTCAGVPY